jgi:hypothetical protein
MSIFVLISPIFAIRQWSLAKNFKGTGNKNLSVSEINKYIKIKQKSQRNSETSGSGSESELNT